MLIGSRRLQAPEDDGEGSGAPTITPERAAEIARLAALEAAAPLIEKVASLEGRLAAQPAAPPPDQPKIRTRAELDALVRDRQITEAQRDDILDRQRADETRRMVQETVTTAITGLQRGSEVDQGLAAYRELKPDAWKAGSKERERVKAQYDYLVRIGQPATAATELVALQTVYGSVDALRAASSGRDEYEEHRDTGGGGGGGGGRRQDGKVKLSPRERAHYQRLIDRGVYPDMDAVHEELKYARPEVRARHGAAA